MVAPHIEMETIKKLARSRSLEEREALLQATVVPDFRQMKNTLKALRVVGQS
jgi:hypothetical protein